MVTLCSQVTVIKIRKKLKNGQVVISMSPGHCKTDMGGDHATRTCLEGAQSIYDHIVGEYSSDIFYHVGKPTDFLTCGWLFYEVTEKIKYQYILQSFNFCFERGEFGSAGNSSKNLFASFIFFSYLSIIIFVSSFSLINNLLFVFFKDSVYYLSFCICSYFYFIIFLYCAPLYLSESVPLLSIFALIKASFTFSSYFFICIIY